jgi:hypothetical protein
MRTVYQYLRHLSGERCKESLCGQAFAEFGPFLVMAKKIQGGKRINVVSFTFFVDRCRVTPDAFIEQSASILDDICTFSK